jgi:biopolymer transport protein ExbD
MSGQRKLSHEETEIDLPITPMLDMAFQLLTFFIFTYNPSGLEAQMDLALPSKTAIAATDPADMKAETQSDIPKEAELPLDLSVEIRSSGASPYILVEGVNPTSVETLDALKEKLTALFTDKARSIKAKADEMPPKEAEAFKLEEMKKMAVKVQGNGDLEFGKMVETMDACRTAGQKGFEAAGFNVRKQGVVSVSFAPPSDERAAGAP